MSQPAPYWPDFNPRTGLWCVRDDRGPIERYEDIETRGEAEHHALDLIAEAEADAAAQDELEAAAATLAYGLGELLAEAA